MAVAYPVRLKPIEEYVAAKHGGPRFLQLSETDALHRWAMRIYEDVQAAQGADDWGAVELSSPVGMSGGDGDFPVGFVFEGPDRSTAGWKRAV